MVSYGYGYITIITIMMVMVITIITIMMVMVITIITILGMVKMVIYSRMLTDGQFDCVLVFD